MKIKTIAKVLGGLGFAIVLIFNTVVVLKKDVKTGNFSLSELKADAQPGGLEEVEIRCSNPPYGDCNILEEANCYYYDPFQGQMVHVGYKHQCEFSGAMEDCCDGSMEVDCAQGS